EDRTVLVWTHPDYDAERGKPAPTLYLLADEGQSAREWAELGRVPQVLDNLAVAGELEPMVVVMADVNGPDPRAELLDSLVPAVQKAYRVGPDHKRRAVAGIGTGATTALEIAVREPNRFASVGSFSGALEGLQL